MAHDLRTQAFEQATLVPRTTSSTQNWKHLLTSPVGTASIGALVVMVAVFLINPPCVRTKNANDVEASHISLTKVVGTGVFAGLLILAVPYAYTWWCQCQK